MSDDPKPDLTKSVVGKMLHDELAKLEERQAARDAAQDALLNRPSRKTMIQHAETAAAVPSKAPVTAIVVGAAFTGFAGWQLFNHPPTAFNVEAGWRIGCLVFGLACFPGVLPLAVKNLRGVVGLWKTLKNGNGSTGRPTT